MRRYIVVVDDDHIYGPGLIETLMRASITLPGTAIGAQGWVMLIAILLDVLVLGAFAVMKWQSDPVIVVIAVVAMVCVFAFQRIYLRRWLGEGDNGHDAGHG